MAHELSAMKQSQNALTGDVGGIQTVILCGGRGTRLREYTEAIPKVLVEVGGQPILWHIMKSYATAGFDDFVLALGYLGDLILQYFDEATNEASRSAERWAVAMVDTGPDTNTGGRIKRLERLVSGPTFFATYGDGVSDLDLKALLDFHSQHGKLATVTVVRPRLSFGLVEVNADGLVSCFREKPRLEGWINGGFFVFDRGVFDYLDDDSILEREPLERLAADGELVAYRHDGFWACMDTYKDNVDLNAMWAAGTAPWRTWEQ
jgi:glucose-1-phosphate cytidylyltransferase